MGQMMASMQQLLAYIADPTGKTLTPLTQVPLGVGLGLYHQMKKDGQIAMTSYGDGAANQGQVQEVSHVMHAFLACDSAMVHGPVLGSSIRGTARLSDWASMQPL